MGRLMRAGVRWFANGAWFAAGAYASYAAIAWYRYGQGARASCAEEIDSLLDRFMPDYEAVEREYVRVAAPAEITFAAACDMNLQDSTVVRAIFKARELILGGAPETQTTPRGLAAQAREWGWGVLAEIPGREIVFGAATQPWLANPVFRALSPEEFGAFCEPGFVKIAWTLRADPVDAARSVFRTETRVTTTDAAARAKFRRYWAFLSPGIILIRWISLGPLRAEAERRAWAAASSPVTMRVEESLCRES